MPARILYITPFSPTRVTIGAESRSVQILGALRNVGDVEVVVLGGHETQALANSDRSVRYVGVEELPRKGVLGKLQWLMNHRAEFPHGCRVSDRDAAMVRELAGKADLTWFFKIRAPNMFPQARWEKSILDVDDVTSRYEQSALQGCRSWNERMLTSARIFAWRRRERELGETFDSLTVCSEDDQQYLAKLGNRCPIHVIPNGFPTPVEAPHPSPVLPPRIGFIGLYDYFPNREGVEWFCRECWPLIKAKVPDARFRVVGRGSEALLSESSREIEALGWVEDPAVEIDTWSAMVVPIRVGGGTRIKIAQAFSRRCPVISTSYGAFGYGVKEGVHLRLGDSPEAFAEACVWAIKERMAATEMAERAWTQFLQDWSFEAVEKRVHAAAHACLAA